MQLNHILINMKINIGQGDSNTHLEADYARCCYLEEDHTTSSYSLEVC